MPLDFDTLQPHGSFIGSAAVVVLSDQDRARDAALNMLRFFEDELWPMHTMSHWMQQSGRIDAARCLGPIAANRPV